MGSGPRKRAELEELFGGGAGQVEAGLGDVPHGGDGVLVTARVSLVGQRLPLSAQQVQVVRGRGAGLGEVGGGLLDRQR